jgi:hypothetical protein
MARTQNDKKQYSVLAVPGGKSLRQYSGFIDEEFNKKLRGRKADLMFREMADNDPRVGAFLAALDALSGCSKPKFKPCDESPEAKYYADRFEEMRGDMASTWPMIRGEILQAATYGRSMLVPLYKLRRGSNPSSQLNSKYNDGLWGWRDWSPRPAESFWRFDFSTNQEDDGAIRGAWQIVLPKYEYQYIPRERMLLFRFKTRKDNPEGLSMLRNAYPAYWRCNQFEEIEMIGASRNLCGLPKIELPREIMDPNASADQKRVRASYENIGKKVRLDEYSSIVVPSELDSEGKPTGYKISLMTSGGRNVLETDPIVKRYKSEMLMSMLASLLELGQNSRVSFSLAESDTDLLAMAIDHILTTIDEVIDREATPPLMRLNDWPEDKAPEHTHGDIEKEDIKKVADYFVALAGVGAIVPSPEDEDHFRELGDLPRRTSPGHAMPSTRNTPGSVEAPPAPIDDAVNVTAGVNYGAH